MKQFIATVYGNHDPKDWIAETVQDGCWTDPDSWALRKRGVKDGDTIFNIRHDLVMPEPPVVGEIVDPTQLLAPILAEMRVIRKELEICRNPKLETIRMVASAICLFAALFGGVGVTGLAVIFCVWWFFWAMK